MVLKRLARLEGEARAAEEARLKRLSDDELAALIARMPPDPDYEAALRAISDDDFARVLAGELDRAAVLRLGRVRHADA